ncbi:MAG: sensor domain-containing diguanylate cyclase [Gallionella sp.]
MNTLNAQCPIPENEAGRLSAVHSYEILDSAPELDFDALTRLAIHALNAPAGVIGLMDSDRLWFKSEVGLGVSQIDRQIAFCAYAIMRPGEQLIVEDMRNDTRFQNNPLVLNAPKLRFYAGAPLIDRNGYALGTIAVVDTRPRKFSESERAVLQDLSTLVISALENRQRANRLSQMAMTDDLTGLANRAQFERTLNAEIAHARRTGEPFTVSYMDLDGFKQINDTLGHAAGDEVLREISRRMERQVRTEDLLARLGGDEFGIFLRQSTGNSADLLARRIAEAVSEPITLSTGERVSVGISIGNANFTDEIDSMTTLLEVADQALYEVKRTK